MAAQTQAPVIVFAGVQFMAESAKILSPQKTVLLPVREAGCPLADTVTAEDVRRARQEHPRAAVVAYVNSSAEVKAEADVCCTSANAVKVVNAMSADEIIFVPDKNLGDWVARHTSKRIIPWAGSCCTHNNFKAQDVAAIQGEHPQAAFLVHPECRPEVCALTPSVMSTAGMLKHVKADPGNEYIIGTEVGLLYRLRKENPGKKFHPLSTTAICRTMKMTTLSDVADALEFQRYAIEVPEPIRTRAARALEAMLQLV